MSLTLGPAHNLRSGDRVESRIMEASINSLTDKLKALETPDRLDTFREGMDAKAWLVQFKIHANGKGWSSEEKMAATMPMYFDPNVTLDWYADLPDVTTNDFTLLSAAFLKDFRPKPARRWELENELRMKRQKANEDLNVFVKGVRREGYRIGLTEEQLVPIILHNLQPNVRALVPGQPTTIAEILDTPVGRGDVQVATTTGLDNNQYQQLMDMLIKQNTTIASLEGQVMAASLHQQPSHQQQQYLHQQPSHQQQQYLHQQPSHQQQQYLHQQPSHQQQQYRGQHQPHPPRQFRPPPTQGRYNRPQSHHSHQGQRQQSTCRGCGGECHSQFQCKAYGTVCTFCNKPNHWARVCKQRLTGQPQHAPGHTQQPRYNTHTSYGHAPTYNHSAAANYNTQF